MEGPDDADFEAVSVGGLFLVVVDVKDDDVSSVVVISNPSRPSGELRERFLSLRTIASDELSFTSLFGES